MKRVTYRRVGATKPSFGKTAFESSPIFRRMQICISSLRDIAKRSTHGRQRSNVRATHTRTRSVRKAKRDVCRSRRNLPSRLYRIYRDTSRQTRPCLTWLLSYAEIFTESHRRRQRDRQRSRRPRKRRRQRGRRAGLIIRNVTAAPDIYAWNRSFVDFYSPPPPCKAVGGRRGTPLRVPPMPP